MAWTKGLGLGTGAVLVLIALLVQTGSISGLIVTGCGPGTQGCNPPTIAASFSYKTAGLSTTVTDTSTWSSTIVGVTVGVAWGDGSSTIGQKPGSMLSHSYIGAGTYTVADTAKGYGGSQVYSSTVSVAVTVSVVANSSGSGSGATGTCQSQSGSTCASFSYNAFSAATQGLNVTFIDEVTSTNLRLSSDIWNFGDGTTGSSGIGGTVVHTYPRFGTFLVTETVNASGVVAPNTPTSWTKSYSRNVTLTPSGCTSGCGTPSSSSAPTTLAIQPFALLFGLLGIGIIATVPVQGWTKLYPFVAFLVMGLLGYALAGGPL